MKLGNYDIGQPIAIGTTGEKQFYYCNTYGTPIVNTYNEIYEHLSVFYDLPHNLQTGLNAADLSKVEQRRNQSEQYTDTIQQFTSPGTSFGYPKETIQEPYDRAGIHDYISPFTSLPFGSNSFTRSQFFPEFRNRLNHRFHSSLYTELLLHNISVVENDSDLSYAVFGNITYMERFTKMLFAGQNMGSNAGDSTFNNTKSHRFVPAGLPWVKFRINSKFKNFEEGVSSTTNQQGVVEYYMLFNTIGHSGVDANEPTIDFTQYENGFYEMANLDTNVPIPLVTDFISGLNSVDNFSFSDMTQLRQILDLNNYIQPTIIADFQNPIFSVSWEDVFNTSALGSSGTEFYTSMNPFPFPGTYNPDNNPKKAPNYGWTPSRNENLSDKTPAQLTTEYQDFISGLAYTGNNPLFFTIDNLFLQDYDILGTLPESIIEDGYVYEATLLNGWFETTRSAFSGLLFALTSNEYPDEQYNETRAKIWIMLSRLTKFQEYYENTALFSEYNELSEIDNPYINVYNDLQPFNFSSMNNNTSGIGWYEEHFTSTSAQKQYDLKNIVRMFGPPAPIGYEPRCGVNFRAYFNLPEDIEISDIGNTDIGQLGSVPFIFNSGLNIGSLETIDTFLGFDASQLVENFQQTNLTDVDALNLFDLELWKLIYDAQNYNVKIEDFIYNEYTGGGTNEPYNDLYIPPAPLFPIGQGGYKKYHTNPKHFAYYTAPAGVGGPENSPFNFQVTQWPFGGQDSSMQGFGTQLNDGPIVNPLLLQLYPNLYGEYDFSNIDNFGGIGHIDGANNGVNTPGQQYGDNGLFVDYYNYLQSSDLGITAWNALLDGYPGFRIYRVRKIYDYEDDYNEKRFEQTSTPPAPGAVYGPWGEYQSAADADGNYIWYVEGYVELQSANPDITYFGYPNNYSFRTELGKPITANNNFNPPDRPNSAPVLVPGEFYVFETPFAGLGNTSGQVFGGDEGGTTFINDETTTYTSEQITNEGIPPIAFTNDSLIPREDNDFAFHSRHPSDYNLSYVQNNSILSPSEFERFSYCHRVSSALKARGIEGGINEYYYYQQIIRHFTNVNVYQNVNPNAPVVYNPYISNSPGFPSGTGDNLIGSDFPDIRTYLLQLSFNEGGIASWEVVNWIAWLKSGCLSYYSNTPPNLINNYDSPDVISEYGSFVAPQFQTIGGAPQINVPFTSDVPVNDRTMWGMCNYLNQFPELKTSAIESISAYSTFAESNLNDSKVFYTDTPYTDEQTGITIEKGFYPADASAFPGDLFRLNTNFYINFTRTDIFIDTEAFGPPLDSVGYANNTPFLQMINELISDGIEGTNIDIFPESTNGNGSYQIADGRLYLQRGLAQGNPDYRPLQLIMYAEQNNLINALHFFLPPLSSPDVSDDTPGETYEDGPQPFYVPVNAVGIFDGVNSGVKIDQGNSIYHLDSPQEGFLPGPGVLGMEESNLSNNAYQRKNNTHLLGENIFTQSTNPTNHPYYFTATYNSPDLPSSLDVFDVSWGHIAGSGSLKKGLTKSPSQAVYLQSTNELLGSGSAFYSVSQSLKQNGIIENDSEQPKYMRGRDPQPDEYVWLLRTKNYLQQGTSLNPNTKIRLTGLNASAQSTSVTIEQIGDINDYTTEVNGLRRYYLSKDGNSDNGCYGYIYPQIGTILLNSKITEDIDGNAATTITQFNGSGVAHLGMKPNGLARKDNEYNNALKLINNLKNNTSTLGALTLVKIHNNKSSLAPSTGDSLNIIACIRLRPEEFNFTTNTTRFVNLNENGIYDTFTSKGTFPAKTPAGRETMKYNQVLRTSPTTYITHVDLYDRFGIKVAVAKLSKPIRKDFNSSVVIKILLNEY